jgi:hypothetical protein
MLDAKSFFIIWSMRHQDFSLDLVSNIQRDHIALLGNSPSIFEFAKTARDKANDGNGTMEETTMLTSQFDFTMNVARSL